MLEIFYSPLGHFVRFRLVEDGRLCTKGLLSAANWERFRAACPGLVFTEDAPQRAQGRK